MQFNLHPPCVVNVGQTSDLDAVLLLSSARTLQRLANAGQQWSLLLGKNLGLLCESDECEDAQRFRQVATDLGAPVAHFRPDLSLASPDAVETDRLLGRRYDGIECIGLDLNVVRRLAAAANVPVHEGIGSRDHPTVKLAERLGAADEFEESHRFVVRPSC